MAAAMRIQSTDLPAQETVNLCTITVRQPAPFGRVQVVMVCSSRVPTMR
jgi:hypothetical protein